MEASRLAGCPFDKASADVILRSSNKVDFLVHKLVLSLASPFFETMFSIPQPSTHERSTDKPIVDVPEDNVVLECLLRYIYPVSDPYISDFSVFDRVLAAANKYELAEAVALVTTALRGFIYSHSLDVYAIACHQRCESVAREAASAWLARARYGNDNADPFAQTPAGSSWTPTMEARLTAGCYFRLLQFLRTQTAESFCDPPTCSRWKHP